MRINKKVLAALAGVAAIAMGLSGCSGSTPSTTDSSNSGTTTIEWWGWAPGYEEAAAAFNKAHTDVQINYTNVGSGSKGGYDKMKSAVQAGNAPCLGQVGAETLTSFVAQDAVEDITSQMSSQKSKFADAAIAAASVGDKIYGVPVDFGTMGFFYRSDLLQQYGVSVPKTWDDFKAAAQQVRKASNNTAYIMSIPSDAYDYAGFAWQAGAKWFDAESGDWGVTINDDANLKIANYWQDLIDNDLIATYEAWSPELTTAWANGTVIGQVGAAWYAGILKSDEVKATTSGKWAVAPMPRWGSDDKVGNAGGSPNAVLKGCKNVDAAVEAAIWLSTNADSLTPMIDKGGLLPAATNASSVPALTEGDDFFGGQKIWTEVFIPETAKVNSDWQWGPSSTEPSGTLYEQLSKVAQKQTTFADALGATQTATVSAMKTDGFTVK
jgi:multiple sugar transport system substrate-binding protein